MPRLSPFSGLSEFVGEYEVASDLIGTLDDLRRVAAELVDDATAEGVAWSEVHLVPPTYAGRLGADEAVLEAVLDGFGYSSGAVPDARSGRVVGTRHMASAPADSRDRTASNRKPTRRTNV